MRKSGLIAAKPAAASSFEEAAAICDGGLNALWCLRQGAVSKDERVLVYGASGAIGTAGVQLAKHFGAEVTGVCGTRNLDLVRACSAPMPWSTTRRMTSPPTASVTHDLRCRRKALVRALPTVIEPGWPLPRDGRLPQRRARARVEMGRRQAGGVLAPPSLHEGGRPLAEGAHRSRGAFEPSSTGPTRWSRWSRRLGMSKRNTRRATWS